jgi:Fe-S-cluster containining protein
MELDELVDDLMRDPSYATERRHPRPTTPDEAFAVVEDVYRTHAQAARHLPVVAERLGRTIACRRGCHDCCHELIAVTHAELHGIARWLEDPARAELRARVVERARAWVAAAGARPAEAVRCQAAGDEAGYRAARRGHALARLLCPANEGGDCAVYDVRPLVCRLPYVVDTAERCAAREPPGPPARLISSPVYERFQAAARQIVGGLEGALGHDPRARTPLPVGLLRELEHRTG